MKNNPEKQKPFKGFFLKIVLVNINAPGYPLQSHSYSFAIEGVGRPLFRPEFTARARLSIHTIDLSIKYCEIMQWQYTSYASIIQSSLFLFLSLSNVYCIQREMLAEPE